MEKKTKLQLKPKNKYLTNVISTLPLVLFHEWWVQFNLFSMIKAKLLLQNQSLGIYWKEKEKEKHEQIKSWFVTLDRINNENIFNEHNLENLTFSSSIIDVCNGFLIIDKWINEVLISLST